MVEVVGYLAVQRVELAVQRSGRVQWGLRVDLVAVAAEVDQVKELLEP